jgi:tetratricopeptide (TPR) repeat protein
LRYFDNTTNVRNRFFTDVLDRLCAASVELIGRKELSIALDFLRGVEQLAYLSGDPADFIRQKTDVFNNLAVIFRQTNKLKSAKTYLNKALNLSIAYPNQGADTAATHLNLCNVLSLLGKHKSALKHGLESIKLT